MDSDKTGLEKLEVWKKSIDLAIQICRDILPTFPIEEKYSLTNQLRRSIQSIPANIAEGYGRFYYQEGIRYCYIARGSLEEAKTQILLAKNLGYIGEDIFHKIDNEMVIIRQMINGYISFLKQSKRGSNEPGAPSFHSIHEDISDYLLEPEQSNSELSNTEQKSRSQEEVL
jgi:four helix bundle protein